MRRGGNENKGVVNKGFIEGVNCDLGQHFRLVWWPAKVGAAGREATDV